MGFAVRRAVRAREALWRDPCILTLTVDRKRFSSPQEAHRVVADGKFIPRLMRMCGIKLWVWVLEFQQETGEGWPHWHLCIDRADLPGRMVPLARAWKLWRDTWHLGGLQLSVKRQGLTSAHALNYITKYLTKSPQSGYPEWVLHAHSIRFVQGCRALGPLVGKIKWDEADEETEEDDPDEDSAGNEIERRTNIDANAKCGLTSTVMQEEIDGCTGEVRYRFLGALPVSPALLCHLLPHLFSLDPDPMRANRSMVRFRGGDVDEVLRWLQDHADPAGYLQSEMEWARQAILEMNLYSNRAKLPVHLRPKSRYETAGISAA